MHRKTPIVSVACALLIFGLVLYIAPSALPTATPVKAATRTINLAASYGTYPYWNNSSPAPTITVNKGDTVNIMLTSDGSQHQLLVDFDGDGASTNGCATADKCSSVFMSSTSISFVANSAGTFYYYCTFHPTYMRGMFIVQSPSGPDFGVTPNPSSVSIVQGSNVSSTITVSSVNNFAGTITLSASASPFGPMTSFSTNTVTVSSGTPANSKLTISIPQSTSAGSYSITVTGTNGSQSGTHTTSVSVSVTSPSLPSNAPSLPLLPIAGGVIAAIAVIGTVVFLRSRKH